MLINANQNSHTLLPTDFKFVQKKHQHLIYAFKNLLKLKKNFIIAHNFIIVY